MISTLSLELVIELVIVLFDIFIISIVKVSEQSKSVGACILPFKL